MQSRLASLAESLTNVVIGYLVSVLTSIIVLPLFGVTLSLAENAQLSLIYTVVSIARSYAVRRAFNRREVK